MNIKKYLEEKKQIVEDSMNLLLPSINGLPHNLHRAMRYSIEAGGKRIRPILAIASCNAVGGDEEDVITAACSLEFIHTYSLIHDDLPAMDDDDYRRGKPTCHRAFNEATAVLAGDALLTAAFEVLSRYDLYRNIDPEIVLEIIHDISRAAGFAGMVGGQQADLEAERKSIGLPNLEFIHTHKTGALILASVKIGAKLGGCSDSELKSLIKYGEAIGLAFQVADDILDVTGTTSTLGKDAGSDEARGKATYPSLLGLKESKIRVVELLDLALSSISEFDSKADPLRGIAKQIVNRNN